MAGRRRERTGDVGQAEPVSAERRVAHMRTKLGLSDGQDAAVKLIMEERFERGQAVMDQARPGGSRARGELQALMDDLKWEIDKKPAAVPTEEQMLAYSRWVEEEAAQKPGGDRPEPPDGGKGGRPAPKLGPQSPSTRGNCPLCWN